MSQQHTFHFTIGPVQGFVAQARRTRDFWAGSFLLSWLSGVAMLAVQKQGGEIEFPRPSAGYLDWLEGEGKGQSPRQGAIPNRFKARVSQSFNARQVENTVREAWIALAEHVWCQDFPNLARDGESRRIWERQHANFWEISWIVTSSEASDLLDRRKNWRSHLPPPEPGVKCMVMDGWQELSGAARPNSHDQQRFWQDVRSQPENRSLLTDLAEGEKLCAIAFVKRRFARHFEAFKTDIKGAPSGENLKLRGWKLETGVPSVSYMAAAHWLEAVLWHPDTAQVQKVLETAEALDCGNDEWKTRIRCLEEAVKKFNGKVRKKDRISRRLIARNGSVFFDGVRDDVPPSQQQAQQRNLTAFKTAVKELKLDAPLSPFYAILLMDGDSLGVHMGDREKQPKIAAALDQFTGEVPRIVQSHNGFLVYAGGDDVLAILPLEDALVCAKALRDAYLQAFEGTDIPSTLSGAIEFAHIKMPLGRILSDAHDLLDHVAKDGCGRNALAVRVWKPGGCDIEWGQPWRVALDDKCRNVMLQQLADEIEKQDGETTFSNAFFYKIRERFELLNPTKHHPEAVLTEEQEALLLASEYLSSGVHQGRTTKITLAQARELVEPLLQQCRPQERKTDAHGQNATFCVKQPKRLEPDGALLVRFLAHKGIEPRGSLR